MIWALSPSLSVLAHQIKQASQLIPHKCQSNPITDTRNRVRASSHEKCWRPRHTVHFISHKPVPRCSHITLFLRQHWGNFWDGWSAYGLSQVCRCHHELSWAHKLCSHFYLVSSCQRPPFNREITEVVHRHKYQCFRGHKYKERTPSLHKTHPSHTTAQTPCVYYTQKGSDLYDRMHFN